MPMFKKDTATADPFGKTNRIVTGTTIKGDISTQTDFRLDGSMEGNFTSEGKLVIGPGGSFKGNINCKNLDIEGTFEGKLQVAEQLNIRAKAVITGEVFVQKLAVEPGAAFNAICHMGKQTATSNKTHVGTKQEPEVTQA